METEHYPRQMNLDGCECPVIRGGIAQTLCFTDLTGEEQQQYLNTLSKEIRLRILCFICFTSMKN